MLRLFLLLFCMGLGSLWAQAPLSETDSLPSAEVQAEFLMELADLMTDGKPKPVEEAYRNFVAVFSSGSFTPEEQSWVTKVGMKMRSLRLGATPYFQSYLSALVQVKQSAEKSQQFTEWHQVLEDMLDDEAHYRPNYVGDFLEFSQYFFEFNALRYSLSSTSWYIRGDVFSWNYEEQPVFRMENVDLVAQRSDDTLIVRKTNGVFYPLDNKLVGSGGQADWARTDIGTDAYVELESYTLETMRSLYEASVAYLHYPLYFGSERIKGTFADKLVSDNSRTSYPRFESESDYLNISNVGEGIRLRGGFRLHGNTVYAYGSKERPAEVLILNARNQPRYLGSAKQLLVKNQDRIVGENVRSVMYLGADSLYHPSVNLRYSIPDQEVQLKRGDRGSNRNPFFHSLHQMNIEADYINAYLQADSIVIGKPTVSFANKDDVIFESLNYFNKRDYQKIQSIATANPLAIMKATAEREGTNYMDASLLASRLNSRFTVENIQTLLYDLVAKGFINYDPNTQQIELKDKIYHYVNADQDRVDFDYLRIVSKTDSTNAVMDLDSGFSVVNGVKKVEFSKIQKVAALPTGGQLFIKGDRNFDFDGRVFAGFSQMEGKDFYFKYSPFHIQMDSVRYFDLFVPTGEVDDQGQPVALSIGSRIEHLSGVLLIDAPENKSGREDIFLFPSLQSKDYSYVFYDRDSTESGAYGRDSFYYRLTPFSFDHLDRFGPQDLNFKGTLFSAGIFPDIEQPILLQDLDQSLGFSHSTPAEGYDSYGGKGNYTGDVNLSNAGLLGQGKLKYLNATINSEDFTFLPDKMLATAERFDLEEDRQGEFPGPQVRGEDVSIEWRPYQDSMLVRTAEELPFDLFQEGDYTMNGLLVLTPNGLRGAGTLSWPDADVYSRIFSFGPYTAVADTMNVKIKLLEKDDRLALKTDNVKGMLDFDKREGHFEANDEYVVTTLPYNQYITSISEFNWDMEGSKINFKSLEGVPGVFTSIHPDQDSLQFEGQNAVFDLQNSMLLIEGVDYMVSADAFIYPDSQVVEIGPNAEMTRLENARIVADTANQYHVINRATVDVRGRRFYEASGFYEYNVGPHEQEFELQNIVGQPVGKGAYSEKRTVTRATGEIEPTDTFFIDHKTQFRGTISLNAESAALKFDGFARIVAENLPRKTWFTVSFEGDKNDLRIKYDIPKSYDGEPLFTGIFLSKEFSTIYPRIMSTLQYRKDRRIFPVTKGVFDYDPKTDEFIFGDSSIMVRQEIVGNRMVFKNRDGSVEAEGKFNLGEELKYVNIDAAGSARTAFPPPPPEPKEEEPEKPGIMLADEPLVDPEPDPATEPAAPVEPEEIPVTADLMLGLDMLIPESLLKIVENDFKSATFEATNIIYLNDIGFFRKSVYELFPPGKDTRDAIDGLSLGFLDIPKRINNYEFLFSKVPMKWNGDYQSFISTDKNLGLVSVAGEPLNKMVEAYIEVKMPSASGDDRLYIYLKSPSGLYYFFGFKQGILSITSNNTVFMQQLEGMKEKELIQKMPDGETFEIQAVEVSTANIFLRRVQAGQ